VIQFRIKFAFKKHIVIISIVWLLLLWRHFFYFFNNTICVTWVNQYVKCRFMQSSLSTNQQVISTCCQSNTTTGSIGCRSNEQQNDLDWSHNTFGSIELLSSDDQEETADDFDVITNEMQTNFAQVSLSYQNTEDATSVVDNETISHESLSSFDFDEYSSTTSDDDDFLLHTYSSVDCIKDETSTNGSFVRRLSSYSIISPIKSTVQSQYIPTKTVRFGKVVVYEFQKALAVDDRDFTKVHVFVDCNKIRKKMKRIETSLSSIPIQPPQALGYSPMSSQTKSRIHYSDNNNKNNFRSPCTIIHRGTSIGSGPLGVDYFECCPTPPTRPQRSLEELPPFPLDDDEYDSNIDNGAVKCDFDKLIAPTTTTTVASINAVLAIAAEDMFRSNSSTTQQQIPVQTVQTPKISRQHSVNSLAA
jgi:hypothetical protein